MPNIQEPISQLTDADLPLQGDEFVPIVQDGATKKTTIASTVSSFLFGAEFPLVLAAGLNNNVPVAGGRALCDTTAGDATITGFDATLVADGNSLVVTNTGPNMLTLADSNGGSLAANQLYCITDMTLPPKGSMLLERSGTLTKWVIIS